MTIPIPLPRRATRARSGWQMHPGPAETRRTPGLVWVDWLVGAFSSENFYGGISNQRLHYGEMQPLGEPKCYNFLLFTQTTRTTRTDVDKYRRLAGPGNHEREGLPPTTRTTAPIDEDARAWADTLKTLFKSWSDYATTDRPWGGKTA
jgi:hypothetical protein